MVGGKMAEKADKAKRTARASACMIRKGFLSYFPPAILTPPESAMKTAHQAWSDASVMMAADAFSVGLMIRLRLFSMMCHNPSPKPIATGGRFAGDFSCTIPRLSADNRRCTALIKKWQSHKRVPKMTATYKTRDALTSISAMVKELSVGMARTEQTNLSLRDTARCV
ncbi:serine/threonine-protein kinase HSL1,negative regulator of Swe1 kinase [Trypanosoma cruzi]|nr:serine/threonine-protein kinase HSL1,negative regulator of Swe1 kinase [Trypanosoma cruzi]